MNKNILIAIPCFNESANIGRTIQLIRKTGFNGTILVVNDGSTDKGSTVELAKKNGAEVITLPKNFGKASAIFAAFKEGLKRNCTSLITFDADMHEIPKRDLEIITSEAEKATTAKKTLMVVAFTKERSGINWLSADISGIRAYSRNALWKINRSKDKGKVKGFGIEAFLNLELGERETSLCFHSSFVAGPTLRQGERQTREIQQTLRALRKRINEVNARRTAERALRRQKPQSPEDIEFMRKLRKRVLAAGRRASKKKTISFRP